ncbi:MAG: GntR family transcriptional regulator [Bacteroidetes bacterium]|nr:GntR family transcriptional regulator [Bacteroidota bacterium]MCH8524833.1 GntR family transcriptional regulator [Balneolales bacterium]
MAALKEGIPRHTQITRWVEQQIREHNYKPDEKLPSENELATKFDVSRVTIRRALQSLESNGLIYRCQGLGSFVSNTRTPHNLVRLTDFNEDMVRAGMTASSEVRNFTTVEASEALAQALDVEPGQLVVQIDRLRLGNGEPIAFDSTWMPVFYGQLIKKEALEKQTIYRILEESYDIQIIRGTYHITADVAVEGLCRELHAPPGSPLLRIDRSTYTIGDKPVYFQKRYYRSDRVMYEMTLERNRSERGDTDEMPLKEFCPIFKK